jgi:transcription antitermination factor NusG
MDLIGAGIMNWHVAVTDPCMEGDAVKDIAALGFPAWTPVEKLKKWRRGRYRVTERALFPRYVFAAFDLDQPAWNEIRHLDGIFAILENNGLPQTVPVGLVEQLQKMQRYGMFDRTRRYFPFECGDIVELDSHGPFANMVGKVLRARAGDRAEILINYMAKEMTVNVHLVRLAKLNY